MTPLIWNGVARQADTVLPMVRVTRYGPMRLTPFSRRVSMASIWFRVEAPPEPMRREQECPPPAPPQAPPPIETGDPRIDAAAAAGSVPVERDGARLKVACVFDPCAPCPLAFAFAGCRVETRGDQKFLLLEFISPDYGTAKDVE